MPLIRSSCPANSMMCEEIQVVAFEDHPAARGCNGVEAAGRRGGSLQRQQVGVQRGQPARDQVFGAADDVRVQARLTETRKWVCGAKGAQLTLPMCSRPLNPPRAAQDKLDRVKITSRPAAIAMADDCWYW
jgi:hypothetical protein